MSPRDAQHGPDVRSDELPAELQRRQSADREDCGGESAPLKRGKPRGSSARPPAGRWAQESRPQTVRARFRRAAR
jgi:hypothetical protein